MPSGIIQKRLGSEEFEYNAMEDFNMCLQIIDVEEHPSRGFIYTWCNNRGASDRKYRRIDQKFANEV